MGAIIHIHDCKLLHLSLVIMSISKLGVRPYDAASAIGAERR